MLVEYKVAYTLYEDIRKGFESLDWNTDYSSTSLNILDYFDEDELDLDWISSFIGKINDKYDQKINTHLVAIDFDEDDKSIRLQIERHPQKPDLWIHFSEFDFEDIIQLPEDD